MTTVHVDVEHVTRIEGHGNIAFIAKDGKVEKVQWQVSEAPRMFESFVRGRHYHQVSHITSRICGICSIGHSLCSLKATEAAMGITISEQTELLRKLAVHGETLQSHILHVGYLVSPDLFRNGSVFSLVETHRNMVLDVVKLHRLANEMSDLLCGRTTHPITLTVGGFTMVPSEKKLTELQKRLEESIPVFDQVSQVVLDNMHMLPDFTRETEYIALTNGKEYAFYDGAIGSTDTGTHPVPEYESVVNEYTVPHSTAKFTRHARDSYMVGALARFKVNAQWLRPLAKKWAAKFTLNPINYSPFMNNVAQVLELYHAVEDSIALIDTLIENGVKNEDIRFNVKAGRGVDAVEVPRGILFHDYTYNDEGICIKANCVIPTNQNHGNIQKDMEALAPMLVGRPEKEIELTLEMLVRAYDPCVSCSTHYLVVKFR